MFVSLFFGLFRCGDLLICVLVYSFVCYIVVCLLGFIVVFGSYFFVCFCCFASVVFLCFFPCFLVSPTWFVLALLL